MDLHFIIYIIEISLTYNFYHFTTLKDSHKFLKFDDFKSHLGKHYYEEFFVNQLFKNIFSKKNYKIFDAATDHNLPDFVITHNQNDIFLIEVKSSAIHFKVLEELDIKGLKGFLNREFLQKKDTEKANNKGVYQLLKHILAFDKTNALDSILNNSISKKKCTIYPIIIYTENVLDMAGINNYFNDAFQSEIKSNSLSLKLVHSVTAINISFFIRYYSTLKNQPSLFKTLLHNYHKKISDKRKIFKKNLHPKTFLESNISFEQYSSEIFNKIDYQANFRKISNDLNFKKEN